MDLKKIQELIDSKVIKAVDLKYAGLEGKWYHINFPAARLESVIELGVPFDGSSIPGMKSVESGDMVLMPDLSTAHLDPIQDYDFDGRVLRILCSICDADTRIGVKKDPRSVALRAQKYLESTGIADTSYWTPEFEFHIFDEARYTNSNFNVSCQITSSEDKQCFPKDGDDFDGLAQSNTKGYHMDNPHDRFYGLRLQMCEIIESLNIDVRYNHHEVGLSSQQEIETELLPFPKVCDDTKVIKDIIRRVSLESGFTATFMPKPVYNEAGNGMHFHMLLKKNGKNIFWNKGGYADLSDEAIWFMRGILLHGRSLAALTNPSTNSYKRLLPGFEAPTKLFFGLANRSAAIRIPKYANTEETKRFEYRTGDATCNPYLAMSALLLAGIDGVNKKLGAEGHNFGPFDDNVFHWSEERKATIESVPENLEGALKALEDDHDYLLAGDVFNEELIESFISLKRKEIAEVNNRPHPIEMALYYNV
jgi:glutamine synthetase